MSTNNVNLEGTNLTTQGGKGTDYTQVFYLAAMNAFATAMDQLSQARIRAQEALQEDQDLTNKILASGHAETLAVAELSGDSHAATTVDTKGGHTEANVALGNVALGVGASPAALK